MEVFWEILTGIHFERVIGGIALDNSGRFRGRILGRIFPGGITNSSEENSERYFESAPREFPEKKYQ